MAMRKLASLFTAVVMAALILGVQKPAAAQTAGVGGDGYSRAMWTGTNNAFFLWKFDINLNPIDYHVYGPYAGWAPAAFNTSQFTNLSYILLNGTDGRSIVWGVDPNLNLLGAVTLPAISGWKAHGLYIGPTGNIGVVWHSTQNQAMVWVLDPNTLKILGNTPVWGPYAGWLPP